MRSARQHILDILDAPERHQDHAKRYVSLWFRLLFGTKDSCDRFRYSTSVVMALAYGKVPNAYDDPDVLAVNRCLTRLGVNVRPGLWRVDVYPILQCVSQNVLHLHAER